MSCRLPYQYKLHTSPYLWCVFATKSGSWVIRAELLLNTWGGQRATGNIPLFPIVLKTERNNHPNFLSAYKQISVVLSRIYVLKVEDLRNASPATVSRAGIIYVSDSDLDWQPVMESHLKRFPAPRGDVLRDLFR